MVEKYNYEVMFDDTSIDVSKEVGLVWSIANSLRGAYTSDKYKDVIRIADRTYHGAGCPYCAGTKPIKGETDLKTKRPDIVAAWDYEANANMTPYDVTEHSGRVVGWVCEYGHRWRASVNGRSNGHGCPYCAGSMAIAGMTDLESRNPLLVAEWDVEKNKSLNPSQISVSSDKKMWWKCDKDHHWYATVKNRAHGQQCPYCAAYYINLIRSTLLSNTLSKLIDYSCSLRQSWFCFMKWSYSQ